MFAFAGVLLVLAVAATIATRLARRRQRFPPVVELAQTAPLPRLGFKIATLTARKPSTASSRRSSAQASEPALPPVPFATFSSSVDAARVDHSPDVTADSIEAVPTPSVYEVTTGPYASPVVQGARITLPDTTDADLPIRFRSAHPNARPIAEVGDLATDVQVSDSTGRIRLDRNDAIVFGDPID